MVDLIHIPVLVEGNTSYTLASGKQVYDFASSQWLDYIVMLSMLKFYSLYFYFKQTSILNSSSGKMVTKMINLNLTETLYVKEWLHDNPFKTLVFAISVFIFISSYCLHLAERKPLTDCTMDYAKFNSFSNTIWCIIISIFTVGYGDMSALTSLGRIITMMTGFIGLLITASLIDVVHNHILMLSKDEMKVIQFMENTRELKKYGEIAQNAIHSAF
jgi:hypothetical protein